MPRLTWIVSGRLLSEQHSIMALSSILKRDGIDSTLVYAESLKSAISALKRLKPDVAAYSLMFGSHRPYAAISRAVRREMPGLVQIAGGPYTTYYPEAIDELSLDAVCVGEGDMTLSGFVKSTVEGRPCALPGLHVREGGVIKRHSVGNLLEDLDSLPMPDRGLFYAHDGLLRNQEFKSFLSGRGCPYLCSYCFNHKFNEMHRGKGKIIRKKSVDYFIEEIARVRADYGFDYAIFEDDVLTIKKAWFEEFAAKFKRRIGAPYVCYTRPDLADRDTVMLLKESGCRIVRMAIETGNEELRKKVLNRRLTNSQIIRAADLIHGAGMKLSVSNMIGLPTETIADTHETVELNVRCAAEHPSAQFFMPYPGMELTKLAIKTGFFDERGYHKLQKNAWKATALKFDPATKKKMESIQKVFALIVRWPRLRRLLPFIYRMPSGLLYYLSLFVKIWIVAGYMPRSRINPVQRMRVLFRFFSFYG